MTRPLTTLTMLACASVLVLPAFALAQDPAAEIPGIEQSRPQAVTTGPSFVVARASNTPQLWATVNICDTARLPDSMGRWSMFGGPSRYPRPSELPSAAAPG